MPPIIEVNHLTKEYQLGHITSLKENVFNTFRRLVRKPVQKRENFKALDDVNFTIAEGEVVGIIGHNGAGKSTLLKHLANISKPTKGKVIVRGSVAPLIEVGAGVNPELTGRENIFLNGAILGIPKKIIKQKMDEIIEFSELEQFIDTPVKPYSSGMTVKLGFSIATSLDADILIIDEVLAVGDLAFQRKCFDRIEDMIKRQGKTVLLCSHYIRQVERLCTRTLLMDHGKILNGDGAEFRKQYQIPDEAFAVGLVGLLIPWKGQELFLDTAKLLRDKIPNLKMLIIGGTPDDCVSYEAMLRQRVIQEQLDDIVIFTGHVSKMEIVYNGLNIVVSASINPEPLGTVVIECMAMGRPLIGPDHGGAAEMMAHEKTGLLFKPGDANALAEAVTQFYLHPDLQQALSHNARSHALETFDVQQHAEKIQAIYQQLLKN